MVLPALSRELRFLETGHVSLLGQPQPFQLRRQLCAQRQSALQSWLVLLPQPWREILQQQEFVVLKRVLRESQLELALSQAPLPWLLLEQQQLAEQKLQHLQQLEPGRPTLHPEF